MELPVYTSLLRVERRLYEIGKLELPRPVTLTEAGVGAGSFLVLLLGTHLVGIGFSATWAWLYLVLPWLAARAASQPVADRKRVHLWALSQVRWLITEPRLLAGLRPVGEPGQLRLRVRIWQPRSDAAAIAPITGPRAAGPTPGAVPAPRRGQVSWVAPRPEAPEVRTGTHPLGPHVSHHLHLSTRWAPPERRP